MRATDELSLQEKESHLKLGNKAHQLPQQHNHLLSKSPKFGNASKRDDHECSSKTDQSNEDTSGLSAYSKEANINTDLGNHYTQELKTILNKSNLLNLKEPLCSSKNVVATTVETTNTENNTSSKIAPFAVNNKENDLFGKNIDKSLLDSLIVSYTSSACATSHSKSITNYQKRKANRSSIAFYQHLKKSNKTKSLKSIRSKQQQQHQQQQQLLEDKYKYFEKKSS